MRLVTGGTGFVGSYLLYQLVRESTPVIAVKRENASTRQTKLIFDYMAKQEGRDASYAAECFQKIRWQTADITQPGTLEEAMDGVEELYHAAAMVAFHPSDKPAMEEVNIQGTANIVNLAIEKHIPRLVYISSIAALPRRHNERVDETFDDERPAFASPYAETKYRAEMEVWRGRAEGLKVLVVNPAIIFGPCDFEREGGSADFFNTIYRGIKFYPTGANAFVDVRDVANKTLKLAERDKAWGQRFILVSENLPYRDVMTWTAAALNVQPPTIRAGKIKGFAGYGLDRLRALLTGSKPKLTPALVNTSVHNFYYDNSKVRDFLNEDFITVKTSIEDSCRFMTESLSLKDEK